MSQPIQKIEVSKAAGQPSTSQTGVTIGRHNQKIRISSKLEIRT